MSAPVECSMCEPHERGVATIMMKPFQHPNDRTKKPLVPVCSRCLQDLLGTSRPKEEPKPARPYETIGERRAKETVAAIKRPLSFLPED